MEILLHMCHKINYEAIQDTRHRQGAYSSSLYKEIPKINNVQNIYAHFT